MEGLFILLRFILGSFLVLLAAKIPRTVVTSTGKLKKFLLFKTTLIISFITVVFFPPQDYVSLATGMVFSATVPLLSDLWRRKRYAAVISLSIMTTILTWYMLYPIDLTGKLICLMFLVLGWLIAKHEILVDFIGRLFID